MNTGNPSSTHYSILNDLEFFRRPDNKFELQMVWPDLSTASVMHFKQTSNPLTFLNGTVEGFEPVQASVHSESDLRMPHGHSW